MATIASILSQRLADNPRLRNVAPALIDEIARLTVEEIALWIVDEKVDAHELDRGDWVQCAGSGGSGKGCGNFGTEEALVVEPDSDGENHLCGACYDEECGLDPSPFGTDDVAKS